MSDQLINGLFVSSMIFFNIFCVVAIIMSFVVMWSILSVRSKINATLESIRTTTESVGNNLGQIGGEIASSIIPTFFKPRSTWVDILASFLRR